jgi:hypothetical protein
MAALAGEDVWEVRKKDTPEFIAWCQRVKDWTGKWPEAKRFWLDAENNVVPSAAEAFKPPGALVARAIDGLLVPVTPRAFRRRRAAPPSERMRRILRTGRSEGAGAARDQTGDGNAHGDGTRPKMKPIQSVLAGMLAGEPREDYAHDPWWIMRVQPNMYRTAAASLLREGFESYGPTFRVLAPMPRRMIPPKKRHQANLFKREIRRRRFEGYLFIRRMFGVYDVNRLFDLSGCGGIVTNASSVALVYDYEIELMRLVEADGTVDQTFAEGHKGYRITKLPSDGRDQWAGQSKIVGRIDDSGKTILFVQRMGRIARLISDADPQGVTLSAKL